MSGFVVMVLVALWVAILVPGALRGRQHSPATSIDSFSRSMRILATGRDAEASSRHHAAVAGGRQTSGGTAEGEVRRRTLHRRRTILQGLASATAASTVLGLTLRGPFVLLFAVTVTALVAYVGLLLQVRAAHEHTRRTVRHLPVRGAHEPEALPLAAGEQHR